MALSGLLGLAALLLPRTRRIGGGSLLGLVVSVLGFVAVVVGVFVFSYVFGANELSSRSLMPLRWTAWRS